MPIAARREAPDLFDAIEPPPTSLTPDVETDLLRLLSSDVRTDRERDEGTGG